VTLRIVNISSDGRKSAVNISVCWSNLFVITDEVYEHISHSILLDIYYIKKDVIMLDPCSFHNSTKNYLTKFYEILDGMIEGMENACLTDSISQNFIVQMIPHHRAAIQMSKNVLKYNIYPSLQDIADRIITMQTRSINNMRDALQCCQQQTNSCRDIRLYRREFQNIKYDMFQEMNTAKSTNNIGDTFMREMIPHHRGAVRMSENALRYCVCPKLVPILNAIITSQQEGIEEMEQLLKCQSNNSL